jgi:hypothetical protein
MMTGELVSFTNSKLISLVSPHQHSCTLILVVGPRHGEFSTCAQLGIFGIGFTQALMMRENAYPLWGVTGALSVACDTAE